MYNAPTYTQDQLANLNENEIQYPYSDEYMVYDGLTHQYRLTRKAFEEKGINLQTKLPNGNNPDAINNFLHDLQTKVYTHIYDSCKSTKNQIDYLIAKRGLRTMDIAEYRDTFKRMMLAEGEYLISNGDISSVSGVDLDTMQNMSIDVVRRQNRDWDKDALAMCNMLGLHYVKRYDFYPQGKNINW